MAKKTVAKKQGVALVVSTKKPVKKTVKRVAKKKDATAEFFRKYKKENPKGGIYFEPFVGPVKLIGVTKNSSVSVNVHVRYVIADPVTGKTEVVTQKVTKLYDLKPFDVKKFLKETVALYKKTYFS
jgi:hypothetical protein